MNIFYKHQLKIARDTLKLHDAAIAIMGGMTKEEATEFMRKHRQQSKQKL